ncbi:MAG: hypothetical protein ACP5UB_02580 [Candidatus Sumerlaeaceae bacterium]
MTEKQSDIIIEFGEREWLAHVGGSFLGPERFGGISWNWLSDGLGWCILPPLDCTHDYRLRLEVAPLALYESLLWEFQLCAGDRQLSRKVIPVKAEQTTAKFSIAAALKHLGVLPQELEWKILKRDRPQLELRLNDAPLTVLGFDPVPHVQPQELMLHHELLKEKNILYFKANYAIARSDVEDSCADNRLLSFRFYRLLLEPIMD